MRLQVVTSADVFGIYMEGVQQHLDDAFANQGNPDASPHFPPAAAAPFANSSLAPSQSDPQAPSQQPPSEQPAAQPQQAAAQVSEDVASLSSAVPQMQDAAAPEAAAAPAAQHTPAELPEGPAQDAAAATAANGIPTAIVPTDNDVVVEAVTVPAAVPVEASAAEGAAPIGKCGRELALCKIMLRALASDIGRISWQAADTSGHELSLALLDPPQTTDHVD